MERNLSLENRLSFNRPIAESTFRTSISNSPSFQWGRKNLNNTSINRSVARSPIRERTGLNKIDARIYADVQSRGLTSRIVKYHESGTKLNRSISMSNLTSESRQFPATRTSKPELPYKAAKQNVSMTHIAPPDKSAFYGNTLSGLLRSSSVITLQHNEDDISSENRPIIHPPVTEKELQPTRSVLEVLKEISRKRINNEDADEADTSKKYCNRMDGDMNLTIPTDYRNVMQTPQTYKRQRESAAEFFNASRIEQHVYHLKSAQNHNEASSPEQHAKRRHCNYNNDITSSLSSSKKSTNKRKLFEYEGDKQQEKQLRFQPEIRLPELSTALSYVAKTPITPIPNTPQSGLSQCISSNEIPLPAPVQKSISAPLTTEALVKTTKTVAEKPKLTLFNKNYDSKRVEPVDDSALNAEDDAYAGIQFVKPKKSASVSVGGTSHMLMERTQKSKLALMLSGLRGELYLGNEDDKPAETIQKQTAEKPIKETTEPLKTITTDNNKATNEKPAASIVPTTTTAVVPTTSTNTQSSLNTNLTPITKPSTNVVDGSAATSTAFSFPTTKPTSTTPPTKISSPLTGIKLTPQTTSAAAVLAPISSAATSATVAPAFSFGMSTATPPTTTTNSVVSQPSTLPTLEGASKPNNTTASTPFAFGVPTTKTATTNQPTLPTFGEAKAPSQLPTFTMKPTTTVSTATTVSSSMQPPTFTFNSNATSTTVSATSTVTTTQSKATMPLFAFGSAGTPPTTNATTTTAAPTTENPKTTTASTPFSFGTSKPAGGFSFGAANNTSNSSAPPATEATKMFSFTSPKTTTATGGFSFGGNTIENKPTAPNVFGSNTIAPIKFGTPATTGQQQQPNTVPPVANNNAFTFGGQSTNTAPQEKTVTTNTFGALAGNTQSKPFSFGGGGTAAAATTTTTTETSKTTNIFSLPSSTVNKPFSFGGNTSSTTATAPAASTNTFSLTNNNNQSNLFSFGSVNSNTNANATSAQAPKPNSTFSFGSSTQQSKPFAFGGASAEAPKPTFGSDQNKPFSFGGANNTIATTDATKANSSFNFSANKPSSTFSFGGASSQPNNTEPPKMGNNTTTNNASSNAFSFGATKPTQTQNSAFGAAANGGQQNVFSFSAGNNNNNSTATPATNVNAVKPTFGGFGNAAQGNTFSFGGGSTTATPATPADAAAKPTAFGIANNAPTQSSAFMFGGGSNNNATTTPATGNLFAMPSNVNSSTPPPFGGAAAGITGTPTSTNLFAPTPSTDRPIRRATRRLTKF